MKLFNVSFVADRFVITTTVEALDEEEAEAEARQTLTDEVGREVISHCWLGEIEEI
jgi:hypothetical protein